MAKRAFERRDGLVIDSYEDPPGQKCTYQGPASKLGESPDRAPILAAIAGEEGEAPYRGTVAPMGDRSPELLESLLRGLVAGNSAAPMSLVRFIDDPRVRPAILAAAEEAPPAESSNFVQVVGIVGGRGACEFLRKRLSTLAGDHAVMADDKFFNALAGSLACTAHALLGLDRDAEPAATELVKLFGHPCGFNRRSAIRKAADAFELQSHTEAMQILRTGLDRLIDSVENDEFIAAGPALVLTQPERFLQRCEQIIDAGDRAALPSTARSASLPQSRP